MASDAHKEAVGLVGGDGPTAERVAAVVAERDELRHRWHRDLAKARAADARIREIAGVLSPAVETAAAVRLLVEDRDACASERDDLRARLAAYESASVEASAETLAALRRMDAAAEHAGRGSCEPLLSAETAAAIRDHLRWLTTRYQREHVGRERAEMQRDVARTERDVLEMQLAERDAVLERIERALGDRCTGNLGEDVARIVSQLQCSVRTAREEAT
jgi:hypothetical protein